jgi:quercetin dioxygenase-like cupin family protein
MNGERRIERPAGKLHVAGPRDGVSYALDGEVVRLLVTSEHTGREGLLTEVTVLTGQGPGLHRHMQHETLFLLEGELELTGVKSSGDFRSYSAGPGSIFHIPGCVPHGYRNTTAVPARLLAFHSPAGLERYLREAGRKVQSAEEARGMVSDPEALLDIQLSNGIEPIDRTLFDEREGYRSTGVHYSDCVHAQSFVVLSELIRFLACSDQTETGVTVLEVTQLEGGAVPLHSHMPAAIYHVLDGSFEFQTSEDAGSIIEAPAGTTLHMPRQQVHSFRNTATGASRLLLFVHPSGLEDFIQAAAREVPSIEAFSSGQLAAVNLDELERVIQLGRQAGIEFPR